MNKKNQPDSLQDLCVFYCINNTEYLIRSIQTWKSTYSDAPSTFSNVVFSKLLDNYLTCHIPNADTESLVEELIQNRIMCNSLCLKRREMLTADNLQAFLHKNLKYLDLVVFKDEKKLLPGFKALVANNSKTLKSINIWNRAKDSRCMELLESISCWKSALKPERQLEAGDSVDYDVGDSVDNDVGDSVDNDVKVMPANTKFRDFPHISFPPEASEDGIIAVKNLRRISYIKQYNDMEGLAVTAKVKCHLVKVMLLNKGLQSFTVVTPVSHPSVLYLAMLELYSLSNLRCLVLSNDAVEKAVVWAPEWGDMFGNLPKLKQLQHLDLSFGVSPKSHNSYTEHVMKYDDASKESFKKAVIQMTWLRSLDISGTNLTDLICHTNPEQIECENHCMPGFEGRQFDFLGLFCSYAGSHKGIPAKKVSGHETEDQLVAAIWSHWHNKMIMYHVQRDVLVLIRGVQTNIKYNRMLEALIAYLKYTPDWGITTTVGHRDTVLMELKTVENIVSSIYHLQRYQTSKDHLTLKRGRRLLDILVVICSNCARDMTLIFGDAKTIMTQITHVALLVILILDLDTLTVYSFCFERYLRMLMSLMETVTAPEHLMLVLRLIHSAVLLSQDLKIVAGKKLELIQVLLIKISSTHETDGNPTHISKMWSIIWTLTDEVPINCELFVTSKGCDIGVSSIMAFKKDDDLLRNVTGAMCNVSEVAHLRPMLMTQPLVTLFRDLLYLSKPEHQDVTSHAAACLVLLAADGPVAWTLEDPTLDSIVEAVETVIRDQWDLRQPNYKGVEYRSLTRMMKQLDNFNTPTAQYWGVWMICNLVIVKPELYCAMVVEEGGLEKINRSLQNVDLRSDTRELLIMASYLTTEYRNERLT